MESASTSSGAPVSVESVDSSSDSDSSSSDIESIPKTTVTLFDRLRAIKKEEDFD